MVTGPDLIGLGLGLFFSVMGTLLSFWPRLFLKVHDVINRGTRGSNFRRLAQRH
jgi:hypothetical protein